MRKACSGAPRRVLLIDVEGGFGGSSRSLYHLVEHLDRARFVPTVWGRSEGPMVDRLDKIGVAHRIHPGIATLVPRPSRNPRNILTALPRLAKLGAVARDIAAFDPDILHLNYEGLVPLSVALERYRLRTKTVMHMRYMMPPTWFSRLYARLINRHIDQLIFISENERDRGRANGIDLQTVPHTLLYNTADPELFAATKPLADDAQPLRICFLGTIDDIRAPDRLIDLAAELDRRCIAVRFDIFGRAPRNKRFLLFPRHNVELLAAQARDRKVDHMIHFNGHVADPENHLLASDLLIRPSRWNDPWGRDVIEALSAGVPVLSHGTFDRFVVSGRTGFLFPEWNVAQYADAIEALDKDRSRLRTLSRDARVHAASLFEPERYAHEIAAIYERLVVDLD